MTINDLNKQLGGCVFNNKAPHRWYLGSGNDWQLNKNILRIKTNDYDIAKKQISSFETTGNLMKSLVTLHNTGDPLSLYWNETLYRYKLIRNHAASMQTNIPVVKYGRNNFSQAEIMTSLALLVHKVTLSNMTVPTGAFSSIPEENEFLRKCKDLGLKPKVIKENIHDSDE